MTTGSEGPEGIRGTVAFVGIGANLGDPAVRCAEALKRMAETGGITLLRSSSLYRTAPVGPVEQPWFINAVAEVRTELSPVELFQSLKRIEKEMGRTEGERWGPRVIDLDLLLYGQQVVDREELKVPHPEMHRRRFVLEPLCELASYAVHPGFGVSAQGLLDRLDDGPVVERCAPDRSLGEGGSDRHPTENEMEAEG